MFSIYCIASESNQVCLWLPYVLNTTKSRLLILSHSAAVVWQWAWRDDVCSAMYRYYFCTNCTNTQCLLPVLKGEGRFASWVILIGCATTDGPITGNITGSFCIVLLANTAWPSYRRIARSISNKTPVFFTVDNSLSTPSSTEYIILKYRHPQVQNTSHLSNDTLKYRVHHTRVMTHVLAGNNIQASTASISATSHCYK